MSDAPDSNRGTAVQDTTPELRFDAFISYRRKDGSWHARTLRRRLLEEPIPKDALGDRSRRLEIYLDQIYERATEDFFERTIKPALAASRHLVVVQSASASEALDDGRQNWLVREIEYFLSLPREGRGISVAITSGAFAGSLPGDLHSKFPNIERLDLRRWSWYRPGAADEPVLTLAATLLDIPPDRMPLVRQEDAKRRAAEWRVRAIGASALAVVLAGLLVLLAVLYSTSEERRRLATSRLLAAESSGRMERRIDEALLLGVHAYTAAPTIEAQGVLLEALLRVPLLDRVLHGARGQIQRIAASQDARYAAATDNSGTLSIWSITTGRLIGQHLVGPNVLLEAVDFHPDNERVFTATPDGELDVWTVSNDAVQRRERVSGAGIVQVLRVSPDGAAVVTGDLTGEIRVRGVARLSEARSLGRHASGVTSVAFGGDRVATGALDGSVIVQRLDGTDRRTLKAHEGGVFGVLFDGSATHLVTSGLDGRLLRWNLADVEAEPHEVARVPVRVLSLAANSTHSVIATGLADGRVILYRGTDASFAHELRGHTDFVRGLAVTASGDRLLAGASDGRVLVWRPRGPANLERRVFAHRATPQAIAVDEAGESLLSADLGGTVVTWSRDGKLSRYDLSDHLDSPESLSASPDSRAVAIAGGGKAVIWTRDSPTSSVVPLPAGIGPVDRLHFVGNDALVAIAPSGQVTALSWPALQVRGTLMAPLKGAVLSSSVSRDGFRLALGSNGQEIVAIDLAKLQVIAGPWHAHEGSVMDVSFNDDGTSVVSVGDDGYLARWTLPSGARSGELLRERQGRLFSVASWPGRNVVATGDENGAIQFWDMGEGRAIGPRIAAHESFVQALAFSGDGKRLASTGEEGEVAVWETDIELWLATACVVAHDLDRSTVRALTLAGDDGHPCARRPTISPWAAPTVPTDWPTRRRSAAGSSVVALRVPGK